jgi:invasion protein IalB
MSGAGLGDVNGSGQHFVKLCETEKGRTVCSTQHEQVESITGSTLVSVAIQPRQSRAGDRLTVTVPSDAVIAAGVQVKIDGSAPVKMAFTSCTAQNCTAETDATPELLGQMRTGNRMLVAFYSVAAHKAAGFQVPLSSFGGVHDGPPADSQKYLAARRVIAPGAAIKVKTPEPPRTWKWDWGSQNSGTVLAAWVKICERAATPAQSGVGPSLCLTHHEQVDRTSGMASVALRRVQGKPGERLMVMVPIDVAVEPGVQVKIGTGEPVKLGIVLCKNLGCFAEVEVTPELMKRLRSERNMTVAAIAMSGKTLRFPVSLSGFAKADDGPAMNMESYKAARRTLMEMFIRKKLQEYQRPPSPPAGPQREQEQTL